MGRPTATITAPAAAGLTALGDGTRRTIFEMLAAGPRAVGEIAAELPVSRPAVSQHLRTLRDAGLVTDRVDGRRRVYTVDVDGLERVRAYFDQFWQNALAAFKVAAEELDDHAVADPPRPPQEDNR